MGPEWEKNMNSSEYESYAVDVVKRAGAILHEKYHGVQEVSQKGGDPRDDITAADKEINAFLVQDVAKRFPEHSIYSEEAPDEDKQSALAWAFDPIDGTSNFARAIPHFAICASLLENGIPIAGAFYNPVTDELFSFSEEQGAMVNKSQVKASSVADPMKAQILFHVGRKPEKFDWGAATFHSLLSGTKKLKDLGSSSLDLAFVAAGRVDAVVYGTLSTRDIAGAIGMVCAAGGEVYELKTGEPVTIGKEPQTIVAVANRELYEALLPLLHPELL